MNNRLPISLLVIVFFCACSNGPKPIEYGVDGCHYCSMTIVDKIHAAEIVTNKGKVYKFDAIECMVNYHEQIEEKRIRYYLANHYATPEELIDATKATFLISENVPSPMGAYLTGFKDKQQAVEVQLEKGGELYDWEGLLTYLR
ncbi:nitrous oxide reductase accessory protein NosL [Sungkyunkwania multivorans]|uniref:Nitrous oxide reductase accessory protein NosL n=1 Tax=Sungkyunkwania multivorans TaxID=1173618 RepID=A0ABW3D3C9_9FLAO